MSFKKFGLFAPNPATTRGSSTKLSASEDKVVYTNGKSVIIRDLNNPLLATAYSGHVQNTTVARISPSGYYCASADATGTVRVWDTVGEDQTLKGEYKVISGRINDLEWDGESKRIIAVGDGREKFGHAFMMDSGSSTGEISGHSKAINSVAIRHQRPYRAATAGDDGSIIFHQGVPFKYDKTIKTHTKFVQDVRYAGSGEQFASVGSDAKIFIYDGKTGETLREFTNDGHKGSIMACTWSPDGRSLATSSADCTVKLWDVETGKAVRSWTLGTGVNHQQTGNVWSGETNIVSLSMSGDLNVFDSRADDKPRVYRGTQKSITAAVVSGSDTFLGGAADGRAFSFSVPSGESAGVEGNGHSNFISGLAATDGNTYSIGYDDHVREISSNGQGFLPASAPTAFQPKSISVAADSTIFVAEINTVEAFRSNQRVYQEKTKYAPSSIAASNSIIAVGGEDHKVHLNVWDGSSLKETSVLEGNKGSVSALAFSPNGNLLASGDSSGRIVLFDVKEKKLITSRWTFHSGRVNSIVWTSDSLHCASASLDTHVYIWSVASPMKNIAIKNACPGGANAVLWLGAEKSGTGKLASAGADGCVRLWEVTFHV